MENEKKLQPHMGRKALSSRNKVFLDKLADGVPVVDAYRLAGYTGGNHTAYELRRQLRQELREVLEARGFTIEGVASEILNLTRLPVDLTKYPNGIPLDKKIQLLKLFAQTIKDDAPKQAPTPHVTAFIINRGNTPGARIQVTDTTAVTEPLQPDQVNKEQGNTDRGNT